MNDCRISQSTAFRIVNAKIVAPDRIIERGTIIVEDGIIAAITPGDFATRKEDIDAKGRFVAPGFIDLHIHGEPQKISRREAKFGTTGFLCGLHGAGKKNITATLAKIEKINSAKNGARALGIYMEGPYLNPQMRGALPESSLKKPRLGELEGLVKESKGRIKVMVVAPELKGAISIIRYLKQRQIVASLGHTGASYEEAERGVDAGISLATHTFNRMREFGHREPGAVGCVLEDDRISAEVVLDGVHVHPAAFRLLLKCKGKNRVILITDSVASGPLPGSTRRGIIFRLKDGTFAGSALTMNAAARNAAGYGASVIDAVRMAALNPARILGIDDKKGSIKEGKDADLVVFDKDFEVKLTIVEGRIVYGCGEKCAA